MQSILKEVLKFIRPSLPATIEIKEQIQGDFFLTVADPAHIHQIAMNLVTNAYHAMQKSGGTLSVSLKNSDGETLAAQKPEVAMMPYVVMTVANMGIGMREEVLERIFDPFFTTKEDGKDTGLGLSVVYGIVKALNGEIIVKSKQGEGTIFEVYLPAHIEKMSYAEPIKEQPILGGTERILIVDDGQVIIQIEKAMLERIGYTVEAQTSSLEALERFKAAPHEFDLVITDMTMPKMTGEIFAWLLMQIRRDIPVIISTGFNDNISAEKSRRHGIKGFLLKPVVLSEFAREVRRVLDEARDLKQAV